jgi:amylosucrase
MDWAAAARRAEPGTVESALWDGLRRLIAARVRTRATHAWGTGEPLWTGNDHVYGLLRTFAGERLLVLASFSALEERVPRTITGGVTPTAASAEPDGRPLRLEDDEIVLAPYQFLWVAA